MNQNELYHYGIPGQKWYIRRYQNKDGSLTPAGRKRAAKLKRKYTELTGRDTNGRYASKNNKSSNEKSSNNKKITIKDMSTEELKSATSRLNAENDFMRAIQNHNQLNPKKVSLGKRFVTHVGKNIIAPAATEAGKRVLGDYFTKIGREAAGLSNKKDDPMEELKKEVKTLELERNKLKFEEDIDRYKNKKKKK